MKILKDVFKSWFSNRRTLSVRKSEVKKAHFINEYFLVLKGIGKLKRFLDYCFIYFPHVK